jgi:hypothetical protein
MLDAGCRMLIVGMLEGDIRCWIRIIQNSRLAMNRMPDALIKI